MQFKDRLASAMAHANVTRVQLADFLRCSDAAIGAALRGESKQMSAGNVARTARYCGVNIYWLATGEESMVDDFSSAAREIARQIDALHGEEHRRAVALCRLVAFSTIPADLMI